MHVGACDQHMLALQLQKIRRQKRSCCAILKADTHPPRSIQLPRQSRPLERDCYTIDGDDEACSGRHRARLPLDGRHRIRCCSTKACRISISPHTSCIICLTEVIVARYRFGVVLTTRGTQQIRFVIDRLDRRETVKALLHVMSVVELSLVA